MMKKIMSAILCKTALLCKTVGSAVAAETKSWRDTLREYLAATGEIIRKIYLRARRSALKYGRISGLKKFFCEIKRETVKHKKILFGAFNFCTPIIAAVVVVALVTSLNGVTLAYEVSVDGETLGYVENTKIVDDASDIIMEQVEGDVQMTTGPALNLAIVANDQLDDANALSEKMIENSDDVKDGCGLYINGKLALAADNENIINGVLKTLLDDEKEKYKATYSEFADDVSLSNNIFAANQFKSANEIKDALSGLKIKVAARRIIDKKIKYDTSTRYDSSKYIGYKKVTVSGEYGKKRTIVDAIYIGGKLTSRKTVSSKVVKKPVDEQVVVGTKKIDSNIDIGKDAIFSWPVERIESSYISQYFGEYGHGGIDIAVYRGTQIYAATSGKVEKVQWHNSYGNMLMIKGENGVSTLYAHCDTIDVSVGQVIAMGQPIATVGSTGNSTGPHLHFEVRLHGDKVNPAPYLGIN